MTSPASQAATQVGETGSITIAKDPVLPKGMDYLLMRREGIAAIASLGGKQWTDYNPHDPGITLLESLIYAITDLSYRAGWDVADLLADAKDQPFFTAREVLTVNPVTPSDYRRLLIDLDKVRNAWVVCKQCPCGEGAASVKGLYDIQIELDSDDLVGDLNDRVITRTLRIRAGAEVHEIIVEARFPQWELADEAQFEALMELQAARLSVECIRLMRARTGEALSNAIIGDEELRRHWRNVFYATLHVAAPADLITIPDVTIRLFGTTAGKNAFRVADLLDALQDGGELGILPLYRRKARLVRKAVASAKACYHAHRNLDEDLCRLSVVSVGQVAVCAEIEVELDADIERVQAQVWFEIEKYLAPRIPFHSLAELCREGVAVEDIFEGPALDNGFIRQTDLDASTLRAVVRGSDLINLLTDVEGVRSISNLLMTRYDDEGNPVKGVADPAFVGGEAVFDPNRVSAAWLLFMAPGEQPRLYHNLSNFAFRKNGLPFTVDQDEACGALTQIRGTAERPKHPGATNDLSVPLGIVREAASISPVQYLLPFTYGVGPEGLPRHAGDLRRAQARQLKAYLMVYEQLLGNAFEQLAHVGELYSLGREVERTYFAHAFDAEQISDHDAVVNASLAGALDRLCETGSEFLDRRNAFLDHVMARFGLDFGEYALLLTNWKGESQGKRQLIDDKLGVLEAYREISRDRARAFDHRHGALDPANVTVLSRRIALLLGYAELRFEWTFDTTDPASTKVTAYALQDARGAVWARGTKTFSGSSKEAVTRSAADYLLRRMSRASAYTLHPTTAGAAGYRLVVRDATSVELAEAADLFASVRAADDFGQELIATASVARRIIVEHLLLRPKFPGDAIYKECGDCEDADPWSFRLTVVMPGWTPPYNADLDWRAFANRTIRAEVPAHLLTKVCWVGDDAYEADRCDPVVDALTKIIEKGVFTAEGARPTCEQARACAEAAYDAHAKAFAAWHAGKEQRVFQRTALPALLDEVLALLAAGDIACGLDLAPIWTELKAVLVAHFVDVVVRGLQFTRFEQTWFEWLEEDGRFDWGDERLVERLHAMLKGGLNGQTTADLCACAEAMLGEYGQAFSAWMDANLERGLELDEFSPFEPPRIALCGDAEFTSGTADAIAGFLAEKYRLYTRVSYRLSLLVRLLESLVNTYPAATLHDCDDGSDHNPVRLNQTALGSLGRSAGGELHLVVEPEPAPSPLEPPPGPPGRSTRGRRKRKR